VSWPFTSFHQFFGGLGFEIGYGFGFEIGFGYVRQF
jgi:hypothetical protein